MHHETVLVAALADGRVQPRFEDGHDQLRGVGEKIKHQEPAPTRLRNSLCEQRAFQYVRGFEVVPNTEKAVSWPSLF